MRNQKKTEWIFKPVSTLLSVKFQKFILLGGFTWLFACAQMYLYTQVMNIGGAPGYAITLAIIVLLNFILNRYWIFYSVTENQFTQGAKYVIATFIFRFLSWCLFVMFNNYMGILYYISIFLSMLFVLPLKYLAYKIIVFKVSKGSGLNIQQSPRK